MKRLIGGSVIALSLVLALARAGYAGCGKDPGDNQKVIDARTAAEQTCGPCSAATNHGTYVSCVAGVANTRANDGLLPQNCKGKVKKCAAKSNCGKPGFVTCCITNNNNVTKCKLKSTAQKCFDKGGSVQSNPSCCSNTQPITTDAC